MANKKKERTLHYDPAELEKMTHQQKLARLKGLEEEIESSKQRQKDQVGSEKDLRTEMEARKKELLDSIPKDLAVVSKDED